MGFVAITVNFLAAVFVIAFAVARAKQRHPRTWRLYEVLFLWNFVYWLGTCVLLLGDHSDQMNLFAVVVALSQLSCTAAALWLSVPRELTPEHSPTRMSRAEQQIALWGGGCAAAVCLLFVLMVVRNDQLGLMLAGVLTGDSSFLEYRLAMSTGEAIYLAPGYVKQFRDVILPTSLIALSAFGYPRRRLIVGILWLMGAAAAVLSGERYVIMIYVYTVGALLMLQKRGSAAARRGIPIIIGVAIFAAFVGATVLLGRAEADATPAELFLSSVGSLLDRVIVTAPRENFQGFLVWSSAAPAWGRTWAADLAGILPGVQANLSNELSDLLGGSAQGASPLGLPADIYLAWGVVGAAVLPFVYMCLAQRADTMLVRSDRPLARALRVVLVPLSFAWYSPFLFVLNGGFVFLCAAGATVVWAKKSR